MEGFNEDQKSALEEQAIEIEEHLEAMGFMAPEIVFISNFLIERNIKAARKFEELGKGTSQLLADAKKLLADLGEETEQ